jgi:hypothetical protein
MCQGQESTRILSRYRYSLGRCDVYCNRVWSLPYEYVTSLNGIILLGYANAAFEAS